MTWTPTATRADVIRLIARYLRLEFSIRSAAGRLVMDEDRVARKRRVVFDISEASEAETWDALRIAGIRDAVYAPPADPARENGSRLRRVAPLRDVARIVRVRTTRSVSSGSSNARDWRATVAQKLGSIPRGEAVALLTAERLRVRLVITRNRLEAARREHERSRGTAKRAKARRTATPTRPAESKLSALRSRECADDNQLKGIVRSDEYRRGVTHLLRVCTRSEEVESYLFGAI
jgi:hypothetical protein